MRVLTLLLALVCVPQAHAAKAKPRAAKPADTLTLPAEIKMGKSLSTPELQAGQKKLDEIEAQIGVLVDELEPMLGRLQTLTQGYQRGGDLDSLLQQREKLYAEIGDKPDKFNALRDESERMSMTLDLAKLNMGFGQFMSGQGIPENASKDFAQAHAHMASTQRLSQFKETLRATLAAEQAAYQAAVSAAASRKRAWQGAAAGAGAILAVGGLVLLLRRRKEPLTVQASPVLAGAPAPRGPAAALPAPAAAAGQPALPGPSATAPPVVVLGPGTVLGENYRLDRELGRGGMGIVYEATDLALSRKVAIKRMHEAISQDGKELEMFMSEARLVAQLKHPNIVEIYSILREKGQTYLIFEYVAGTPLAAFLRGRRLPLRAVKPGVRQIGAALDYAHSCKVIHRDLKPSNVMVSPQGLVKVMDFGIAHQASMTVARLTRTQSWGTPPYMAPEQELGHVSRESDIFSLGVCLYEMLAGRLPYTGPNFLAQKQQRLFVPPSKAAPGLPAEADAVLAKVLDPDPARRYHSGRELAAAVDSLPEPKA